MLVSCLCDSFAVSFGLNSDSPDKAQQLSTNRGYDFLFFLGNANAEERGAQRLERRQVVDWDQRRQQLDTVLERYRVRDGRAYDCIVPVSGGKDSTFQALRLLELGLNPLCVTATTDHLTALGRRNIENLKRLGVDYVEITTNPVVRRRINRLALTQVGDISWPEHVTIFTIPVRMAVQFGIPLIVELGVFLDVMMGFLVMQVFVYHIHGTFESIDVEQLNQLRH